VRDLCKELGWEEELIRLWNATEKTVVTDGQPNASEELNVLKDMEEQFAHLAVEDEVDVSSKTTPVPTKEEKEKAATGALPVSSSQAPSSETPHLAVEHEVDVSAKTAPVTTKEDKEKASTGALPASPSQTPSKKTPETAKEAPTEPQNAVAEKRPGDVLPPTEEGKL
jgi:NAD-dependent histone deacetylase SIR2